MGFATAAPEEAETGTGTELSKKRSGGIETGAAEPSSHPRKRTRRGRVPDAGRESDSAPGLGKVVEGEVGDAGPGVLEGFDEWQAPGRAVGTRKAYASALKHWREFRDKAWGEQGGGGAGGDPYMSDLGVVEQMRLWKHFGMYLNRDLRIKGKSWLSIRSAVKSSLASHLRHELFAGDTVSEREAKKKALKVNKDEARECAERRERTVKLPAFSELESVVYRRTWTEQDWSLAGRRARSSWIAIGAAGLVNQRASSLTSSAETEHVLLARDTILCLKDRRGREVLLRVGDPWPSGVLFNGITAVRFRFCTNKGYAESALKSIPGVDDRSRRYILSVAEYVFMTPQLQLEDPLATAYSCSEGRKVPVTTRRACTPKDLNAFIKDAAAELGFPRSHFSSTSFRKWGPTEGSSAGADGGYAQAMGGWKSGGVMTEHYNKTGLSYRPIGERGGKELTAENVRAMVPVDLAARVEVTAEETTEEAAETSRRAEEFIVEVFGADD